MTLLEGETCQSRKRINAVTISTREIWLVEVQGRRRLFKSEPQQRIVDISLDYKGPGLCDRFPGDDVVFRLSMESEKEGERDNK